MSQARLIITKEAYPEIIPQVLKNKDTWSIWTFGNPDVYGFVLKTIILAASPLTSSISTAVLIFGKYKQNPYFFLPWIMLTFSSLISVQTDNLKILKNSNDLKLLGLNSIITMMFIIECVVFYEVVKICKAIWRGDDNDDDKENFE